MGVALWLVPGPQRALLEAGLPHGPCSVSGLDTRPQVGRELEIRDEGGDTLRSLTVPTGNRHTLAWDSFSNFFFYCGKMHMTQHFPCQPRPSPCRPRMDMACGAPGLSGWRPEGLTGEVHGITVRERFSKT